MNLIFSQISIGDRHKLANVDIVSLRWIRLKVSIDAMLFDVQDVEKTGQEDGITVVIVVDVPDGISAQPVLNSEEIIGRRAVANEAEPATEVVLLDSRFVESTHGIEIDDPIQVRDQVLYVEYEPCIKPSFPHVEPKQDAKPEPQHHMTLLDMQPLLGEQARILVRFALLIVVLAIIIVVILSADDFGAFALLNAVESSRKHS